MWINSNNKECKDFSNGKEKENKKDKDKIKNKKAKNMNKLFKMINFKINKMNILNQIKWIWKY